MYTGLDRLHLVSRLDRETSGIVLLAKVPALAKQLQGAIERSQPEKVYLSVLKGQMEGPRQVDALLGRDTQSLVHVKVAVRTDGIGKPSQTDFMPLHVANGYTLAEVRLITGRKHQIRAHAQYIGHPVAGDKIYGPDELLYLDFIDDGWTPRHEELLEMQRQALHAWKLKIECAAGVFAFTAPVPQDIRNFCEKVFGDITAIMPERSVS
jgi:23S rRNA pseudouridine1911/1915/1917 synthase